MQKIIAKQVFCLRVFLLSSLLGGVAIAGTLQSLPQSAASLGDALAGSAALADNPDTSYYNPAGSPWIQRQDMGFSFNVSASDNRFNGQQNISPTITGFSAQGRAQAGGVQYLPALFYVAPVNKNWGVGFSITSPYQARLDYGQSAVTRYSLTKFYLNTSDISPSVGYHFTKSLAAGFGIDSRYASLNFNRMDTTSSISNQAQSKSESHGWGWGVNGGLIWQPAKTTRFGLSYHSQVVEHMGGNSQAYAPGLPPSRLRMDLRMPSQFMFSAYQHIKTHWDLLSTVTLTRWSTMQNANFRGLSTQSGIKTERMFGHLHDSWYFAGGARYHINSNFLIKSALAYQQAAVGRHQQTVLAPNVSQVILALGTNYKINHTVNIDIGYSHYFNNDSKADIAHNTPTGTIHDNGKFSENQDLFGIQLNWLMT